MTLKWKLALLLLLLLPLCSCAAPSGRDSWNSKDPYYTWLPKPTAPPLPYKYRLGVAFKTFLSVCGTAPTIVACADRDYKEEVCYITSNRTALEPYVEWHERKHCAGYDHVEP